MIERCGLPRYGGVALRTVRGEVSCDVTGIRGSLKILQVATDAGRAGQIVVIVNVAIDALSRRHSVSTRQRESNRTVIEIRIQPGIGAVARGARRREASLRVVRIAGRLEVIQVAGNALGRHRLELALGCTLVA